MFGNLVDLDFTSLLDFADLDALFGGGSLDWDALLADIPSFDPTLVDVPAGTPDWTPPEVDQHWVSDLVSEPPMEPGPDMGDIPNYSSSGLGSSAASSAGQMASGLGRLLGSAASSLLGGGASGGGMGGGIGLPRMEMAGAGPIPGSLSLGGASPSAPSGGGISLPSSGGLTLGAATAPSVPNPVPLGGLQSRMGRPEGAPGSAGPGGLSPGDIERFAAMLVNIPLPQIPTATPRPSRSGLERLLMRAS